ncbi:MAG TPA: beta-galactosidase [Candidatus Binataceae bacterium]|nr:beta-galactosidase [Candidatus Binataceae bacterium]
MRDSAIRLFFAVLLSSGLGSSIAAAQTSEVKGIYAYNSIYSQWSRAHGTQWFITSSVLTNNNIDGVALKFAWNAIETADGVYAWAPLDNMIAQAAGAGKSVTIDVVGGYLAPSWLFAQRAQAFSFVWSQPWGPKMCSVTKIPVPWDPVFIEKWTAFVEALGARYSANATVTGVKISGLNSVDEETSVPFGVNQAIHNGKTSCTGYNDVANWQAAGYTRLQVEAAWRQIAAAFQSAFPTKTLVATMDMGGFPPIDDNGLVFTPGKYDAGQDSQATLDIIADGVAAYGAQFALQNDGLVGYGQAWPTETSYANQITTGYQTVAALGGGLPAAMNLAANAGTHYLELYPSDLDNSSLQSAIAKSRVALIANAQ